MVLTLNNSSLTVELVDPRQDAHLLGARYCHGGYIFQVTDIDHGELLGTPARPYNVFDGQGIPDAFNLSPLREAGESTTPSDSTTALIIGVGLCDTSVTPRDVTSDPSAPTGVLDAAEWTVEPAYDTLYNVADGRTRTPQPTVTPAEAAPVRPLPPLWPHSHSHPHNHPPTYHTYHHPRCPASLPAEPGLPPAERGWPRRVCASRQRRATAGFPSSWSGQSPCTDGLCAPTPCYGPSHPPSSRGARPSTPPDGLCPIQSVRSHGGAVGPGTRGARRSLSAGSPTRSSHTRSPSRTARHACASSTSTPPWKCAPTCSLLSLENGRW